MKSVYRILAYALAVGVGVEAAVMAFAAFGLFKWIAGGGVLEASAFESQTAMFTEEIGFMLHAMVGMYLMPVLALALLVVAFFAKIPGGLRWALIIFGLVILQVVLGMVGHGLPMAGLLHGANALALAVCAVVAGQRVTMPHPQARHERPLAVG